MKCPKCQIINREEAKSHKQCGSKFDRVCTFCDAVYPNGSVYSNTCGCRLQPAATISYKTKEVAPLPDSLPTKKHPYDDAAIVGKGEYVTILVSDLTGYSTMSEKLDHEEAKEITGRIFNQVYRIVSKYDGFIKKFAGVV